jgi:hypothetical protein
MGEVSIVKQLSGTEALESLIYEIRKNLGRNGRFQPHMAYPGYRAEISVKFFPAGSFVPPVEQEFVIDKALDASILSEKSVDIEIEIPIRPPNQVREDSDMPTPVLAMDDNGNPVEKWVKRKGGIPRNKVKGGRTGTAEGSEPVQTMVPTAITAEIDQ